MERARRHDEIFCGVKSFQLSCYVIKCSPLFDDSTLRNNLNRAFLSAVVTSWLRDFRRSLPS